MSSISVLPWVAVALVVLAAPRTFATAVPAPSQASAVPSEHSAPSLTPDQASVDQLSPALRAQLVADSYAYFRFVNTPWLRAVCWENAARLFGLTVTGS